jgi:hypothetical protein
MSNVAKVFLALGLVMSALMIFVLVKMVKNKPVDLWVAKTPVVQVTPTRGYRSPTTPLPTVAIPDTARTTTSTYQINFGVGDVNQLRTRVISGKQLWAGAGDFPEASWLGLLFTKVEIKRGAKIVSAKLMVYSPTTQNTNINVGVYGDASAKPVSFSPDDKPSARKLTSMYATVNTTFNWRAGNWYDLADVTLVVQEIVNQKEWTSGKAMGFVVKNMGEDPNQAVDIGNYDTNPAQGAKLIITYK